MNKITFYFLCFGLVVLNACGQSDKKYAPIYIVDTLEIKTQNTYPARLYVHENITLNNIEYLRISDLQNKNLLLYNRESKTFDTILINKLWNSIVAFNDLKGIYIFNLDSIFTATNDNKILLINKSGKIINKWNYPLYDNFGDGLELTNHTNIYYFPDSNYVYFIQRLITTNTLKEYSIKPIVKAYLDTNNKIVKKSSFGAYFSQAINYKSREYPPPYLIYNSNDSLFILKFSKCDTFYVYKNEKLQAAVAINSNFKSNFSRYEFEKEKEDYLYIDKYIVEEPSVINIYWDKYRNLYYVAYKHRQNFKNENGHVKRAEDSNFSILIFDNKFNKINEIAFKNNYTFDYTNSECIVLPEGLAIGINHEFQPHIKENKLKFIILDIDKYVH